MNILFFIGIKKERKTQIKLIQTLTTGIICNFEFENFITIK